MVSPVVAAPRCVVLVEGPSDAAALEVLRRRLGLVDQDVQVVAMGGVTNLGHHLAARAAQPSGALPGAVAALCDGSELRVVRRVLQRRGHEAGTEEDLAALGFFVCHDDLEDELIGAVRVHAAVEVVAAEGELGVLRTFQRQPAQRHRSLHDQLHRFAGTTSGRKVRMAAALAAAVPLHRVPPPIAGVLAFAHAGLQS